MAALVNAKLPGFAFNTGICSALITLNSWEIVGQSIAFDNSLWLLTSDQNGGNISAFDYASGSFIQTYESSGEAIQSISAASFSLCYMICKNSSVYIASIDNNGNFTNLGSLPNGATPNALSSSYDGALWALDTTGKPWSYVSGAWQDNSSSGTVALQTLSIGQADYAVGLGSINGGTVAPLSWTQEGGWVSLATASATSSWLSTCYDGSLWYLDGTSLTVVPPTDPQKTIDVTSFGTQLSWTAGSQMICLCMSLDGGDTPTIMPVAYGILEMNAVPFPAMTTDQQSAYAYINSQLSITNPLGIRGEYVNTGATFAAWSTSISNMAAPTTPITQEDWSIVQNQILIELGFVEGANTLLTNLNSLQAFISPLQSDELTYVQTQIDPHNVAKSQTEVSLIFSSLVSTALTRMGSLFPAPYSFFVSLIGSALNTAYEYSQNNTSPPSPAGQVNIAYGEMATMITTNTSQILIAQGNQYNTIVQDWGKLSSTGQAVDSVWSWPSTFDGYSINALKPAWDAMYYQALMPAAWQILEAFVVNSAPPPPPPWPQAPSYSQMTKGATTGNAAEVWLYICCEIGSTTQQAVNKGPYPSQDLLNNIFALNVQPTDFFGGTNGWALPVATSSLWETPPASIPWDPYVGLSN